MDITFKVPSGQSKVSHKRKLTDATVNKNALPRSYSNNTTKEETILEYVEDFRRQFVQVFPQRRPLLLCPTNECAIRKFVCSTIRPCLLPYHEVYDLKQAANFVADFLEYIPLDNPTKLPDYLPSPTTTIELRAGDCLDFSNFLCSLLRGAGYNAFCVSGYAPKWICTQDQARTECPSHLLRENALESHDSEHDSGKEGEEKVEDPEVAKYLIKTRPEHTSKYLQMLDEKAKEEEEKKKRRGQQSYQFISDAQRDPLHGDRVHCWVLVMKGRRDITENVFIEPTTGAIYPIAESPYTGLESVWNEHNYWANVQSVRPQKMEFDLAQSHCWEYVLIDERQFEAKDSMAREFESVNVKENDNKELTPEQVFDDRDILDSPVSWCKKIVISRGLFQGLYPRGQKTIKYHKSMVEKFAPYTQQVQGLRLRNSIFHDTACTKLIKVIETFSHRSDHLIHRISYPYEQKVKEAYEPGREGGLKELVQIGSNQRHFYFYPNARVDGMVRRDETIGVKVVEVYENRDDFLVYRSISVGEFTSANAPKGYTINLGGKGEQPVRKITEKYARNPALHPEEDIRKRTHIISDMMIRLDYHYGENYITASRHTIDKHDKEKDSAELDAADGYREQSRGVQLRVDPNWRRPTKGQQKEELGKLLSREKELMAKVKDRETHLLELVQDLGSDKEDVSLEKTIYDLAHEQSLLDQNEKKEENDDKTDRDKVDYLSPFLAQYPPGKALSYRQAMQAKEECLATLKDRLLERALIIQQHLEDENQELHQRQATYKRQQGAGPGSAVEAEEEFTKYYKKAKFRIDILRARLARHEELACKKYVEMEKKLNQDSRLGILHSGATR